MAREYGQIQSAFWTHPDIRSLSHDTKLIGAYLLTSLHTNGIGCFFAPEGYASGDLGYPIDTVSKAYSELTECGFMKRCPHTDYVFIPKFLRWNPISNPKVGIARVKELKAIPTTFTYLVELVQSCRDFGAKWPDDFDTVCNTLCQRVSHSGSISDPTRPDPIPDPIQPEHPARAHEALSPVDRHKARFEHTDDFERFKAVYPERSGSQPWRKAMDAATARLKEGHDFAAMVAGAERYHRYTDAIGDTGTKFVMQAATFLGPEKHFTEPWDPPKSASPQRSSTGRYWDNLREAARETNQ